MSRSIGFAESGAAGGRSVRVAALALLRNRRLLMVMVAGNRATTLRFPSGTVEEGESPRDALLRGCREELAVELDPTSVSDLFTVLAHAHEAEGRMLSMTVYSADTRDQPHASGDGDSLYWASSADVSRCSPAGVDALARLTELDLID